MVWLIAGLSILLLLWTLYQEWTRANRKWRAARMAACVAAVSGLAFTAVPPSYTSEYRIDESAMAVLTRGWDRDSLQAFLKEHPAARVLNLERDQRWKEAAYLPDLSLLPGSATALHVLGSGLEEDELRKLNGRPFRFHPVEVRNSVQQLSWNRVVASGAFLRVQGSYANTSGKKVSIVLSGFGTVLDSLSLPPGVSSFRLTALPRQVGRVVYTLSVLQGRDTVESGPVPVEVETTAPLWILLLSSSPDFEKKFLKNWLAGHGFRLTIRTAISSGKWDKEFMNRAPVAVDRITPGLLQQHDLVITDGRALSQLSAAETTAWQGAVAGSGMGLLVQADTALPGSAGWSNPFLLTGVRNSLSHTLQLRIPGEPLTLPLTTDLPLFIRGNEGIRPVVQDREGRALAACLLYGQGRIGITTINNSFTWQLSGQPGYYHRYWSSLLSALAPKEPGDRPWRLANGVPVNGEAVEIRFTGDGRSRQWQAGSTVVYPSQDHLLTDEWQGVFWPRKAGWYPVLQDGANTGWFYVFDTEDWKGVRSQERIRRTKGREQASPPATGHPEKRLPGNKEVPRSLFFGLFLVGCGFLWYEKKRHVR